jgi:hypothetical protein
MFLIKHIYAYILKTGQEAEIVTESYAHDNSRQTAGRKCKQLIKDKVQGRTIESRRIPGPTAHLMSPTLVTELPKKVRFSTLNPGERNKMKTMYSLNTASLVRMD